MGSNPEKTNRNPELADDGPRRPLSGAIAWQIPPLPWILSAGRPHRGASLLRVLFCGAIPEALIFAKSCPEADVVVVDSSEKATRALKVSAKRRRLGNLVAVTAELDQPALAEITGRNFDLIIAEEVLDSPLDVEAALENLRDCASRNSGTLYLKVMGTHHPLLRLPEILPAFQSAEDGTDQAKLPQLLVDLICSLGGDQIGRNPVHGTPQPLSDWLEVCARHGFHYAAGLNVPSILGKAVKAGGSVQPLFSFERQALLLALDVVARPASHYLTFSTVPCPEPPWNDCDALASWRPIIQFWPRSSLPVQQAPFNRVVGVQIQIQRVLPTLDLQLSSYVLELLRTSDGNSSLSELMKAIPYEAILEDLVPALYFFYHTSILNLFPPEIL